MCFVAGKSLLVNKWFLDFLRHVNEARLLNIKTDEDMKTVSV